MNANERLKHWRGQYRQVAETLDELPFNSIARPLLEQDLSAAAALVAHYETALAGEDVTQD